MNDDAALLRRFADEGSEVAFRELVERHVHLVYGAAMRRTGGDAHRAANIAQDVFVALARNARNLSSHTVLAAWLHTATRNAALKHMISEQRRRARETAAAVLAEAVASGADAPDWETVRPVLDAAVDALPEADRAAVVLRFLERRAFAEIGAALRVSEDAARMRTERALEKLRTVLGRRGIRSTAAALAAVVSSQPLISAPAGLAAALATQAIAAAGAGSVMAAAISFMSAKTVITAGASAVVAFLIGGYVGLSRPAAPEPGPNPELIRLEQTIGSLRGENRRLQDEAVALQADVAALKETNATLAAKEAAASAAIAAQSAARRRSPNIGMVRHELEQAVLNNLRQIAAARDQYRLERGASPESVQALVGPKGFIRRVRTVGGEDYAELALDGDGPLTVTTPDGISVTYDPAGVLTTKPDVPPEVARAQELGRRLAPVIEKAVGAFRAANNGSNPPNEKALLPYFATTEEGADFLEMIEAQKAAR